MKKVAVFCAAVFVCMTSLAMESDKKKDCDAHLLRNPSVFMEYRQPQDRPGKISLGNFTLNLFDRADDFERARKHKLLKAIAYIAEIQEKIK